MRTVALHLILISTLSLLSACGSGEASPTPTPSKALNGEVNVILKNYSFVPERLSFSTNETVKFVMNSSDSVHSFTIRKLGINWMVSRSDEPIVQEYTFTKPGTYQLICIISGHAAEGMVGEVVVE
ncbi:MAG: hypothetical protein CL763_01910 [Chloroflexi bacterium]|nr:hypothetical protein [Chloroflexota bacterium]|tara:strand:- start:4255 stop:4632 length:378 start_codon:yes stop_codon:yes gene_type:complete